jgi:hypothetical protein
LPYSTIGKSLLEINLAIMERKIVLIISIFVFLGFSLTTNAQSKKKSDAESEGLRGKVKSVKGKYYEEKRIFFGLIPINEEFWYEYSEFNYNGNIIYKDKPSYHGGDYRDREFYKYNERGDCIESIDSNYENGNKYTYPCRYEYIYDEKGNISEEKWYSYNKLNYNYYYKYDDKGNCIEELSKGIKDSTFWKDIYIRDTNGRMIVWERYNRLGDFDSKLVYTLDEYGNRIKEEYYYKDGNKKDETFFVYNLEGDMIMKARYFIKDKYISVKIYEYKYDDNFNWVKRIEYDVDMRINSITKRKIKYYKD